MGEPCSQSRSTVDTVWLSSSTETLRQYIYIFIYLMVSRLVCVRACVHVRACIRLRTCLFIHSRIYSSYGAEQLSMSNNAE